jgi:hypothetical protein
MIYLPVIRITIRFRTLYKIYIKKIIYITSKIWFKGMMLNKSRVLKVKEQIPMWLKQLSIAIIWEQVYKFYLTK